VLHARITQLPDARFGVFARGLQPRGHSIEHRLRRLLLRLVEDDGRDGFLAPLLCRQLFVLRPAQIAGHHLQPPAQANAIFDVRRTSPSSDTIAFS
jgi:hypothetical protein